VADVTAPGQFYEITDLTIGGVRYRGFRNAPKSLRELFDLARGRGDDVFLVYEDERWSYAQVMASVDALGAALVNGYQVHKGDRVAIGMRNLPEWVIAFGAIHSVGAVSVSLNAWWSGEELGRALEDSGTAVLIADVHRAQRAAPACRRLGIPIIVARSEPGGLDEILPNSVSRAGGGAAPPPLARWEDVVVPGAPLPEVAIDPEDDATILYTAGTTAFPRGAVSTQRAVLQALTAFGCRVAVEQARDPDNPGWGEHPVSILAVPLFHVTGCIPVMLAALAVGMRLVIMHHWDPEEALELIERERVTTFVGVPTESWDLLQALRTHERDTSSLVNIAGGGAPAPPALARAVKDRFSNAAPSIAYGMTETNAYGPGNFGEDYLTHPESVGRAVPILEIEIRDRTGVPVPVSHSGEIWLKGPNLIRGYWNSPEDTAKALVDGWLRTGDLGHLDEEGFLYIEDRVKDVVLRGGENIFSPEVEAVLYEHPAVLEAAVFGVPDERLGEELAAAVTVREGHEVTAEELQAHVAARLASFKVPSLITITHERLPRSAVGKILKREIRSSFYGRHAGQNA